MKLWHFAVIFVILNVLDVATTQKALALGATEINPVFQNFNIFLVKFVGVGFAIGVAYLLYRATNKANYTVFTGGLCLLFGLVVLNNSFWILRAGGYL